jgi:hypothetical protein
MESTAKSPGAGRIHPNGLDGRGGGYLLPALSFAEVARLARGRPVDPAFLAELRRRARFTPSAPRRALAEGRDPKLLEEAGWGVVFPAGADAEPLRQALAPLLELRRGQAARLDERLYREIGGAAGYREGETTTPFLERLGAGPGPVDPTRVPYYLLLVGSPEAVPFRLQYQLGVQHAVGRLSFDSLEEYRRYAESVVAAETGAARGEASRARRAVFFAPANPGDEATRRSSRWLVPPLAASLQEERFGWQVETVSGPAATRARLAELLGAEGPGEAPALVFTAGHGVGFESGDPLQAEHQGALVCQDWPGPGGGGLERPHWLAAEDVGSDARPAGLVAFFFACFGAGTPREDDFTRQAPATEPTQRRQLAPQAFVSRLPRRLLGHPRGGALAVVGHVERAWDYSFLWEDAGSQTEVFSSALRRLLGGHPVGSALEFFGQRYAQLEAALSEETEALGFGKTLDEALLARLWTAARDARNTTLLGDPAVRVAAAEGGGGAASRGAAKLS